jgi:hypothetical protein
MFVDAEVHMEINISETASFLGLAVLGIIRFFSPFIVHSYDFGSGYIIVKYLLLFMFFAVLTTEIV